MYGQELQAGIQSFQIQFCVLIARGQVSAPKYAYALLSLLLLSWGPSLARHVITARDRQPLTQGVAGDSDRKLGRHRLTNSDIPGNLSVSKSSSTSMDLRHQVATSK